MAELISAKIQQFEEDQKNKPGPLDNLKKAVTSKAGFILFVVNPAHWMFVVLIVIATWGTLEVWSQLGGWSVGSYAGDVLDPAKKMHWGFPTDLGIFSVIALWIAAFASLFQTTIQDQIDWFRGCNDKLQDQVDQLKGDIEVLKDECDQLGESLEKFKDIRIQMEAEATKQGVSLTQFQADWNGVFDNMDKLHSEQAETYLEKLVADVSFRGDGQAGLTLDEFKDFCSRCPKEYREALKDKDSVFHAAAGEDNIIDTEECQAFITNLVKTCKGGTKGK